MKIGYYLILNIEHNVPDVEIKKAFHKLAHIHHPDKNGGKDAEFKKINTAYTAISTPEKRRSYDLSIGIHNHQSNSQKTGFDIFSEAYKQHMKKMMEQDVQAQWEYQAKYYWNGSGNWTV